MKFPFDFSIKLIFRMISPGMILAAAMAPASDELLNYIGLSLKVVYSYPFAVVAWGWVIVVCDMPIYMLFEGRRYWPHPIRRGFIKLQQLRLGRLLKKSKKKTDLRRRLEAEVESSRYPVNADGVPYAEFPTRLGNIIEEYETYSDIKYGIEAIFYWYRLWVVIDKAASPPASGNAKCCSREGGSVLEQITNTTALGGHDDRLSPLLIRVPRALWRRGGLRSIPCGGALA